MTALLDTAFRYYYLTYFFVALVIALLATALFRMLAFRIGALDYGEGRRVHEGVVPRLGGGGIYLAFCLPMVFALTRGTWSGMHFKMTGVLLGATVIFLIGALDDLKGAPIRNKLIAEVAAGTIVYLWGIRIEQIANPFNGSLELGWLSLPVTVLWIVVITNAFNLIDGLDGLAAGTGILISATLFFLHPGSDMLVNLAFLVLIGGLLGFLRHNFPPATIFMGDSGSLLTGFLLATLSMLSASKATAMATIMLPIIAFAHPLMDMIYAVLRRYHRGLPLGEADREHIHHKLLEMGLSRRKVLIVLYGLNIILLAGALYFVRHQFNVDLILLLALAALGVLGMRLLGYIEFRSFTMENLRIFQVGRKRRFFLYVIKRFRNSAARSVSGGELRRHLDELMAVYRFSRAEILLTSGDGEDRFYAWSAPGPSDDLFKVEFPLLRDGERLGRVTLAKDVGEDYLLCTTELARALSEGVGDFVSRLGSPG